MTNRKNFFKINLVVEMNVEFELGNLKFEWDSNKDEKNFEKHGLKFKLAARVFLDKNRYKEKDEFHSLDENRIITIGLVRKVLTVVYTERGEKIRIISARRATKSEEEKYYGQFNYH